MRRYLGLSLLVAFVSGLVWFQSCSGTFDRPQLTSSPARIEAPPAVDADVAAAPSADTAAAPSRNAVATVEDPVAFSVIERDFIAEAGRAELDQGGLLIDLGTLDQHKYDRGGWASGWGRNRLDNGVTVSDIIDTSAWLDVVLSYSASELVVRGRSTEKSGRVRIAVDGHAIGTLPLATRWQIGRLALPPIGPGRHRIEVRAEGRAAKEDTYASVDWLWLARDHKAPPPALSRRAGTLRLGKQKRWALLAPSARAYSFYLDVPPAATLTFDFGGERPVEFAVRAHRDNGPAVELASAVARPGQFTPFAIDLASLAGSAIRLELVTRGPAAPAGWGRLALKTRETQRPAAAGAVPARRRPRNLILLLIDTARADVFAPYREGGGIGARVFDSLAQRSAVFRNAYNNENWTKPSIATTFSGVYPGTHGARWRRDRVSSDLELLSEHLQAQGFATAAFVSNTSAGAKFGFDQGWDVFEKTGAADHAFDQALQWLDKRAGKRFFLYIQTIDAHVPYDVPRSFSEPFYPGQYRGPIGPSFGQSEENAINHGSLRPSEDDVRWVKALYHGEILYHDYHFGRFVEMLARRQVLGDSALVILNDHGEEFGEHGRFGHGWTMYDALFRSPLLFHFPPFFGEGLVFDQVVEHVDVAATLVDALGVAPLARSEGVSLVPLIHGTEPVPRLYYAVLWGRPKRRAVRVGAWKLIVDADDRNELYRVATDRAEADDQWDRHPIAARLCEIHLGEALANPAKTLRLADRSQPLVVTPEYIR